MKAFGIASLWLLFAQSAVAMIHSDSRVVSLQEIAREGIKVEVRRPVGQADRLFVSVEVLAVGKTYRSMAFSVLDKPIDADFASTDVKKIAIRDSKRWAREERGSTTEKKSMFFALTKAESLRCYVVLHFWLPPKDGIPVLGTYYLIVSDAEKEANKAPEPTTTSVTSRAPLPSPK